jgi:hypothetical protein
VPPRWPWSVGHVASSHAIATIFETRPTPELAGRLADRLLGEGASSAWRESAQQSFAKRQGNLREVLFELYDLYELQRRT